MVLTSVAVAWPMAGAALGVSCTLAGSTCPAGVTCDPASVPVSFAIDETQFSPALSVQEPPRRAVTTVDLAGRAVTAEPFMIGDVIGFWQDNAPLGTRMLTVAADGRATYHETPSDQTWEGTCAITQ